MRSGRIGLAQNRLPASSEIADVQPRDFTDAAGGLAGAVSPNRPGRPGGRYGGGGVAGRRHGQPVDQGRGRGQGAQSVLPAGRRGIAASWKCTWRRAGAPGKPAALLPPHVFTTSYLTHEAIEEHLRACGNYGYPGPVLLSPGRSIGLRMVPMERDLRFAWEEMPQQLLDEQAQKVRESLHGTLIQWARQAGEGC